MSFFATIVQDDRPVPIFSYGLSMALTERTLGDAGYIECPAVMPLALNSWLVIGFLNELHNTSGLAVDQEVTQRSSVSTQRAAIFCAGRPQTLRISSTDDEQFSGEENSIDDSGQREGVF